MVSKGSAQLALAPSDGAIAVVADAGGGSIDLFRAVPSKIRVSSRVKNKAIKPEHIADGNMETAWNSATGELVGAWIEVSVDGAQVDTLKMTVGHTGHGPKGEDYFTMNPRIKQVKIDDEGKPLRTFDFDIDKRELQAIHVAPKGTMRITVTAIEPGSMAKWRETAISELQVWGVPDATWKRPKQSLTPDVEVNGVVEQAPDPCEGVEKTREDFIKEHEHDHYSGPGAEDHAYPPNCEPFDLPATVAQLPPPWSSANGGCDINDEIYGPKICLINFKSGTRVASIQAQSSMAHGDVSIVEIEERDVIPGGHSELVVRFKADSQEWLGVCRTDPTLACTETWDATGTDDASAIAAHPLKFN